MTSQIAVVGMACRVPGAHGLEEFWRRLADGPPAFAPFPPERFDPAVYASELPAERIGAPWPGALLEDYDVDWATLRLPPVQVERMHRMERVAFGTMIEALADAGVGTDNGFAERARVFIGASGLEPDPRTDHGPRIRRFELASFLGEALEEHLPGRHGQIGELLAQRLAAAAPPLDSDSVRLSASITAGRLANLFDFRGGHLALDAGTASSLAALHEAFSALETGACDLAVVCATSPLLTPSTIATFAHRYPLSASAPRPFAASADGTVLGEGCAAVVLMRQAAVDGRRVYAHLGAIGCTTGARERSIAEREAAVERAARAAIDQAPDLAATVDRVVSRAGGVPDWDSAERAGIGCAYSTAGIGAPEIGSSVGRFGFLQPASGMLAFVEATLALSRGGWPGRPDGTGDGPPRAVGVSDAGLGPAAYHAILSRPGPSASHREPRPARPADGIAIVGMGLLVPGASDLESFWRNVLEGREAVGDLPRDRWDVDRLLGTDRDAGTILQTRLAGTVALAAIRSPSTADLPVDPAELMALHCGARALDDAGYHEGVVDPARVEVLLGQIPLRATEVEAEARVLFVGHLRTAAEALREAGLPPEEAARIVDEAYARFDRATRRITARTFEGCSGLSCAAHLAGAYGFTGRTLSVDAACASSLAVLDLGARALARGAADMVVAGGVAYHLLPEYYITLSLLGALSPRAVPAFHVGAAGLVPSEGAGVVVLKRLADAEAAGDRIHAVIRGVGSASDGRGDSIFMPNALGQQRAIRAALSAARLEPGAIDLIEAHGAATPAGDRAEIEGLAGVYAARAPGDPVSVGTIKSHLGHMSSAAGVVGVIKTALALRERVLPPGSSDGSTDPSLPLGRLPIELATRARPWVVDRNRVRRAAVNAYGLGDINYHVVLEEPRRDATGATAGHLHPEPLPARGAQADRFVTELVPVSLPDRVPLFPLRDRHLLLVPDTGGLWRSMAAALQARGARAAVLSTTQLPPGAGSVSLERLHGDGFDGVIDLSAFGPERGLIGSPERLQAAVRDCSARSFALLRALYERLEDASRPSCFVAVTSLGGDLGLGGGGAGDLLGAYLLGLTKALKQELPHTLSKTIDFHPARAPEAVVAAVLREIEDGGDRMEVAYGEQRLVTSLRRENFGPDSPVLRPIEPGDVVLVSGGGRGVLFECSRVLARLGARVVVTGRTPLPSESEPWLHLDDAAFEAYRRAELLRRHGQDPTLTPVRFNREFDLVVRQRTLHRNLARARADGLALRYEPCDVTDGAAVRRLVERVSAELGHPSAVVHGAMVEHSTRADRKSAEGVERTAAVKVLGLANLLAASAGHPPRLVLAFGSGAGRFGNRGQTDYAAANSLMAALLAAWGQRLPATHCVTVDWTAWESVGAAANPAVAEMVRATGVSSVTVEEGEYWFVSEYAMGASNETVIFEERMLHEWPFLGSTAEGTGDRAVELDDRGCPLVPGRWPLIDRRAGGDLAAVHFERRIDPAGDRYLAEHRLHGRPILPFTFGCELLAEAAALSWPGFEVETLRDIRIDVPVKFFHDAPYLLRMRVETDTAGPERRTVRVETRSDLMRNGQVLQADRVHYTGHAELRRRRLVPRGRIEIPEQPGVLRARSFFHLAREPVGLGPLFCRAAWIQVNEEGVTGTVHAPRQRDLLARTSYPVFQVDPLVLDGAFQIAANWDGYRNGFVSVPVSVQQLTLGRRRRLEESVRVRAKVVAVEDPDVLYDIVLASPEGDFLASVRGLRLRRIGPLEPAAGSA